MNQELTEFAEAVNKIRSSVRERPGGISAQAVSSEDNWAKTIAAAACWAQSGDAFFPVTSVVEKLPSGVYRCDCSPQGPFLQRMQISIDHLLVLPDSSVEKLLDEFSAFWKLKPAFAERGYTFKRGMLMWGPPGSGKTSGIWQMANRLVKDHGGIVIFVENPSLAATLLHVIRRIEPERPIVTVMEDLDALANNYGDHALLALLDGEVQIDNVVHVATTNYPHMLDRRFIDRPSRFDTIMKVGMPTAAARRVFLQAKEPSLDTPTLDRWVARSDGYSVAHLREVCIAIQCLKQSEDSVFERLDIMRRVDNFNHLDHDGNQRASVGFT